MEKMPKIILISFAAIIVLAAFAYAIVIILDTQNNCKLESPLFCDNPLFGIDGFLITIGNSAKETIYIQDISFTQKGKEKCIYIKPEILNMSKEYYAKIGLNEATAFFTSIQHPDGICLMKDMVPEKYYDIYIEVTYFIDNEKKISKGTGRGYYSNKTIGGILFE